MHFRSNSLSSRGTSECFANTKGLQCSLGDTHGQIASPKVRQCSSPQTEGTIPTPTFPTHQKPQPSEGNCCRELELLEPRLQQTHPLPREQPGALDDSWDPGRDYSKAGALKASLPPLVCSGNVKSPAVELGTFPCSSHSRTTKAARAAWLQSPPGREDVQEMQWGQGQAPLTHKSSPVGSVLTLRMSPLNRMTPLKHSS